MLAERLRDAQAAVVADTVKAVSIHRGADSYAVDTQPITWDRPARNASPIVFEIGKGTYTHLGYIDANGETVGWREFPEPVVMPRRGTFTIPAGALVEVVL